MFLFGFVSVFYDAQLKTALSFSGTRNFRFAFVCLFVCFCLFLLWFLSFLSFFWGGGSLSFSFSFLL